MVNSGGDRESRKLDSSGRDNLSEPERFESDGTPLGISGLSADELAALVEDLSAEKLELLSFLLTQSDTIILPQDERQPILPQARSTVLDGGAVRMPTSFAQQRLWFLDQLEPGTPLYNLSTAVRLVGQLDFELLKCCIKEIFQRHETLRTIFGSEDGQPYQLILPQVEISLPVIDFRSLSEAERSVEVARLSAEQARLPFDLSQGPLIRLLALLLRDEETVVLVNVHHIVADGWSVGVLVYELSLLYASFLEGQPSPLPPLQIQYADYAVWQRQHLQGASLDNQLEYWKLKLADSLPLLDLPTDRPRSGKRTHNGSSYDFILPNQLTVKLRDFTQREGVTLFMTLLSVFQILLYRYCGQEDISTGVPLANRTRAEIENLIGFFVNTVVLRNNLHGQPSFRRFLQQVKENTLEAFANQDIPFELLVERQSPNRDLGSSPLFQVMFGLQNALKQTHKLPGLSMSNTSVENGTAKFDLSLVLHEEGQHISGAIEFATDLYNLETVQRMVEHYQVLLEHALEDPEEKISHLRMLPELQVRQLVFEWNRTDADFQSDRCVHQLFEEHACQNPQATALVFSAADPGQERIMTYGELNQRANRLARRLVQCGVGPEVLVGILTHRSCEMVVAILGVLKAGGAYLPLDPHYPLERLCFMLEDSQVDILVTQPEHGIDLDSLPVMSQVITLDADADLLFEQEVGQGSPANGGPGGLYPTNNLVGPTNLAYVIYTSGSTGQPKGAQLRHRGICNLVQWQKKTFEIDPSSRVLQFSPISFDASVWEIFMALANGAGLYLTTQEVIADGQALVNLLRRHAITTVTLPPSVLSVLPLEDISVQSLPVLRTVIAAGEACHRTIAERWATGRKFYNAYGPTETTVCATAYLFDPAIPGDPPIGQPIANTQVYVMDPNREILPIGVPGELWIGGVGVARGYLDRPELNKEKFVSNPLSNYLESIGKNGPGRDRLYRTGDLVRWRADGVLEFIGRIDQQVKLRGYRIELGEIEAVIRKYNPGWKIAGPISPTSKPFLDVAVVVHSSGNSTAGRIGESAQDENSDRDISRINRRLVAFLAGEAGDLDSQELLEYLGNQLPEYMLPNRFVILSSLPVNRSGKVDRKALETWDLPRSGQSGWQLGITTPRSPSEEILVGLFSQVLGSPVESIHDSFFELGGHSLLATQLVSRIRSVLNIDIPLRSIFENETVAKLAALISQLSSEDIIQPITPIDRDPHTSLPLQPPRLSYSQQRLWFLEQFNPGTPVYSVPIFLRLEGSLDETALLDSLSEIVRRHEILRSAIKTEQGQPVQVIQQNLLLELIRLDFRDQLDINLEERREKSVQWGMAQARTPIDLTRAPLFRLALIHLSEQEHLLVIVLHHIVADGWSTGVLIREFVHIYTHRLTDGAILPEHSLPALTIQYADFAAWQREIIQAGQYQEQFAYWREALRDQPQDLLLPGDHARTSVPSNSGAQFSFHLDANLAKALTALSLKNNATLFMVLLAGFKSLLVETTGHEDISIGTPIANRNRAELEGLIGLFVNTLVIRTKLDGQPNFRDILQRVRKAALGAYAHQDVPFEWLVNDLQPVRDPSRNPLFQIMFVMQNLPVETLLLPELKASMLDLPTGATKFDLTLTFAGDERGLDGVIEYSTDIFELETIEKLARELIQLYERVVVKPETIIQPAPVLVRSDADFTSQAISQLDLPARQANLKQTRDPEVEQKLMEIWRQVLGIQEVGIFDNFFELGGDSILSIQATTLARQAGLSISPRQMFEAQTIVELARVTGKGPVIIAEQNELTGLVSMLPIQHWFFKQGLKKPAHFNQSIMVEIDRQLKLTSLQQAAEILLGHHDMLRARYHLSHEGWLQEIAPLKDFPVSACVEFVELVSHEAPDLGSEIETRVNQVQAGFDLEQGPLFKMVYFDQGQCQTEKNRLLLVAHHLVMDAVSWSIILEDFLAIYWQIEGQNRSPEAVQLQPKTTSFAYFAKRSSENVHNSELEAELGYWLAITQKPGISLQPDYPAGENTTGSIQKSRRRLGREESRWLLEESASILKIEIQEFLLSALAQTLAVCFGSKESTPGLLAPDQSVLIAIEGHGRETAFPEVDLSRTVGWFTNLYPLRLTLPVEADPIAIIMAAKQQIRAVPGHGLGYGWLRYVHPEAWELLKDQPQPGIVFNYFGRIERMLALRTGTSRSANQSKQPDSRLLEDLPRIIGLAEESSGFPFDQGEHRAFLIEMNSLISAVPEGEDGILGEQLEFEWIYSANCFSPETVLRFAETYIKYLEQFVHSCQTDEHYFAADYDLAGLDQGKLDRVVQKVIKTQKRFEPKQDLSAKE